jgi:hypothetical protein
MKVHLVMSNHSKLIWDAKPLYLLTSYYSHHPSEIQYMKSPHCKGYLLDSGAFSFINRPRAHINTDIDEYVKQYADFLVKNDIKHYFEMDVDSIVGLSKVEKYRNYLENETGIPSIPVWHVSRGKDYFLQMVDLYDYVAIGGIVTKEITPSKYAMFDWFIKEAHANNCKIHGLGLTNMSAVKKYKFDSVDSSSWTSGRYGTYMLFDDTSCNFKKIKFDNNNGNSRLKNTYPLQIMGAYEWIKFQKYAERYL